MPIKKTPGGSSFTRAKDTSDAMGQFTKGLAKSRDSVVGNENLTEAGVGRLQPLIEKDTNLDKVDSRARGKDHFTQETVDTLKLKAGSQVSDAEALVLLTKALDAGNFEKGADGELTLDSRKLRFDLLRFAVLHLQDIDPQALNNPELAGLTGKERDMVAERLASDPNQQAVINEYFAGIKRQMGVDDFISQIPGVGKIAAKLVPGLLRGENGEAKVAYVETGKAIASKNDMVPTAVHHLKVDATPREVLLDFTKAIDEIGGWNAEFGKAKASGKDLLLEPGKPPPSEKWVIGSKPGINWGINKYPTVSSGESVYADVLGSLMKAREHGVSAEVRVIDESGIECKTFERDTRMNMADVGILGGTVLAGIEMLIQLPPGERPADSKLDGVPGPLKGEAAHEAALSFIADKLRGAGVEVDKDAGPAEIMNAIKWEHSDLVDIAELGGAKCVPLDESDTMILKPVVKGPDEKLKPGEARVTQEQFDAMTHFKGGIRVSQELSEIDSLHNIPKPPGRHGIMSNCGSTGACKNFIGVMSGVERTEGLHSEWARTPPRREGEEFGSYQDRLKEYTKWLGPAGVKHADLVAQQAGKDQGGFGNWEASEGDLVKMSKEWVEHLSSQQQHDVDQYGEEAYGPGQAFFEKLAELALLFGDKTTFTYTDMRKTMGSFGPDFGDVATVERSIAGLGMQGASAVDLVAAAELQRAYEDANFTSFTGTEFGDQTLGDPNLPENPSLLDRIRATPALIEATIRNTAGHIFTRSQGKAWLKGGDAFKLKGHAALMHIPGMAPANVNKIMVRGDWPDSAQNAKSLGERGGAKGLVDLRSGS